MTDSTTSADDPRYYQIGTVSSLTGVDAHTIRAWERRYGAIKPARSGTGRRQYDDACIERLQLLKALVDCNEAIGTVAHLPDDELRSRLAKIAEHEVASSFAPGPDEREEMRPRIAMLAPAVARQLDANAVAFSGFEIALVQETPDELLAAARTTPCELVLLELDRLSDAAVAVVQAASSLPGHPQVVLLYRFATASTLAKLGRAGATLCRVPIRLGSLRKILEDQTMIRRARGRLGRAPRPEATPVVESNPEATRRRFDDEQLARLLEVSTALDCECPNHLSSLVTALVAFEQYSRDCESRDAEDAAVHRRLAEGTGEARAVMEELLAELCEHEGIHV
jgi:DNA-binding transcriptional MerR regulator